MHIKQLLKNKKTVSFEIFPPKEEQDLAPLETTLEHLSKLSPDFISVTYGAGGTNVGRSLDVLELLNKYELNSLQHFTCIGNSVQKIEDFVSEYKKVGVKNLLLLRGDYKEGTETTGSDFKNATDLIEHFKKNHPEFCIGGACYPETHIEAISSKSDVRYLKLKQELGAEFLVSQLCFDSNNFDNFIKKIRQRGVKIPIIAGIMPVISHKGIIKMCLSNGCSIPKKLSRIIGKYENNPEDFKKAGMEYTKELITNLQKTDIAGIHLYTLNKYKDAEELIDTLEIIRNI